MLNISGILIGAVIALLGTGLTGYLSFKGISKNIESNISIEKSKLENLKKEIINDLGNYIKDATSIIKYDT